MISTYSYKLRDSCVCLIVPRHACSRARASWRYALSPRQSPRRHRTARSGSQRRQLRKTAGEHMDGVKAWVRQKANNDAPGLVAELQALRADAGECTFDVKKCLAPSFDGRTSIAPLRVLRSPCGAFSRANPDDGRRRDDAEVELMHLWGCTEAPASRRGRRPRTASNIRLAARGRICRIRAGSRARGTTPNATCGS